MKNCDEMVNSLLERREKYNVEKKRKQKTLFRAAVVLCCLCVVVALGFGLLYGGRPAEKSSEAADGKTPIVLFTAAKKDPDSDAFSEDELHHVDVVLNGSMVYRQLLLGEYQSYGFETELLKEDFGEYLGTVTEITGVGQNIEIGAKEPTLAGSDVYYYAKTAKAALVVKKGDNCGLFVMESLAGSFKDTYALHGAESAADIACLTYTIYGMDGTEYKQIESGTITAAEKLESFFEITSSLVPYEVNDGHSVTPQWYNDAWEAYRQNPEAFNREDIGIDIHFKNGTVCRNLSYQPYLTTGCISGMEPLTEAQNAELRAIITTIE